MGRVPCSHSKFFNITFFNFAHAETEIGPKLYEQLICSKWVNFMSLAKIECCVQMECVFFFFFWKLNGS